jgi:methionine-rich copper-binding protein CopC
MESSMSRLFLAALAAPLVIASGAHAEARLAKASPAADSAGPAPKAIELQFSEAVAPANSAVQLMRNDTGANVEVVPAPPQNARTLQATPKAPLAPGDYMVMWSAVGADGTRANGDYNFTVR